MKSLVREGTGFTILLVTLTGGMLLEPLIEVDQVGRFWIRALILVVILAAVRVLAPPRWVLVSSVACGVAYLTIAAFFEDSASVHAVTTEHAIGIGFLLLVVGTITRGVWLAREVGVDTIVGGISVYLMLGAIFSLAYQLLESLMPGSFVVTTAGSDLWGPWESSPGRYPQLLFFSFVTLTTLGYGNLVPASPIAASLAALEAVVGPLYLTVLIARLVGRHAATGWGAGPPSE